MGEELRERIYDARTMGDLKELLIKFYCRLLELEARVGKRRADCNCHTERLTLPFSVQWHAGDPDVTGREHDSFTVVLCNNESLWVISMESRPEAEAVCRRLNKLLTGCITGLGTTWM